jgi:preprotein translocase subunit SecG
LDTLILSAHIVVCVFLVILVLLQSGKEGMGVIFGGGSSSLFGSSGASGILAKMTMFVAIAFVVMSLGYNIATTERKPQQSVLPSVQIEDTAPTQSAPPAVQNQAAPAQEGQNTTPPAAQ